MDYVADNISNVVRFVAISAVVVLIAVVARSRIKYKYAPGPICLPFVGYLPYIFATAPQDILVKLQAKYGNIFGMYIGWRYCVFVNDFKSTKDFFNNKMTLERPPHYIQMSATDNFMQMDTVNWSDHFQFVKFWLRNNAVKGNRLELMIQDELTRVLPKIDSQVGESRFNVREAIDASFNNTALYLICGQWFDENHPKMKLFTAFQSHLMPYFVNNMAKVYFPWFGNVQAMFDPNIKKALGFAAELEKLLRNEVEARLLIHSEACENDYIDLFLTEMKKRERENKKSTYNLDVLVSNCLVLLLAAADTVRNVLEFSLMAMANFPEVQKKIHEELDSVLGLERAPQLSDRGTLLYTEATICEVQRWKTLTPINLLRIAKEDTSIQGYHVPKDSILIQHMGSCDRDPNFWDEPEKFKPERFLSKDLKRVVVPEHFTPFSMGKRMCPGDKVARMFLFSYFTAIMHRYSFSAPDGGLNFEAEQRINIRAHEPIVKISRRHQ